MRPLLVLLSVDWKYKYLNKKNNSYTVFQINPFGFWQLRLVIEEPSFLYPVLHIDDCGTKEVLSDQVIVEQLNDNRGTLVRREEGNLYFATLIPHLVVLTI